VQRLVFDRRFSVGSDEAVDVTTATRRRLTEELNRELTSADLALRQNEVDRGGSREAHVLIRREA
jgi:hypothetical protein